MNSYERNMLYTGSFRPTWQLIDLRKSGQQNRYKSGCIIQFRRYFSLDIRVHKYERYLTKMAHLSWTMHFHPKYCLLSIRFQPRPSDCWWLLEYSWTVINICDVPSRIASMWTVKLEFVQDVFSIASGNELVSVHLSCASRARESVFRVVNFERRLVPRIYASFHVMIFNSGQQECHLNGYSSDSRGSTVRMKSMRGGEVCMWPMAMLVEPLAVCRHEYSNNSIPLREWDLPVWDLWLD
jgi:hypothetical protein